MKRLFATAVFVAALVFLLALCAQASATEGSIKRVADGTDRPGSEMFL
jgi:hypothetical protein